MIQGREYYHSSNLFEEGETPRMGDGDGIGSRRGSVTERLYTLLGVPQDDYHDIIGDTEGVSLTDNSDAVVGMLKKERQWNLLFQLVCISLGALACVLACTVVTVALIFSRTSHARMTQATLCSATSSCEYQIVESIPDQVNLPLQPLTTTTFESWKELIGSAQKSIKIAGFYFTLDDQTGQPDEAKAQQGREIYKMLESAKKDRGINVQIVQNKPSQEFPNVDTERLREVGVDVVDLDWSHALNDGVMHSKFIIVDDASFYLGSANMDWRALTQVKELGVMVRNCSCLTRDLTQIFNIYQYVGRQLNSNLVNNSGFRGYPQKFETLINQYNRLNVNLRAANIKLNDLDTHSAATAEDGAMFFSSSPAKINTDKRTNDVDALVGTINNATEIVNISVMDMIPMKWYGEDRFWWDQIDSALRTAVLRNVTVNLLVSKWNSTTPAQLVALDTYRTFSAFCGALPVNRRFCTGQINVKVFEVPDPVGYPPAEFTRVNHAKYMVTDSQVYITTNNWTWDYFYNTAGVSIISTHESLRSTVKAIFERDWNSEYAHDLSDYLKEKS